jgi:hypothetical protein
LNRKVFSPQAISSDIVEFFDVFKEKVVWSNPGVQDALLAVWTVETFFT